METGHYAYFADRSLNCYELKRIYSYFDYIVGTRFHSMIFSMANMVPGVAITYVGNKGEGIMEDMGLSDYYLRIDKVNTESLIEKFKYMLVTEDSVKKKISSFLATASSKRNQLINRIRK